MASRARGPSAAMLPVIACVLVGATLSACLPGDPEVQASGRPLAFCEAVMQVETAMGAVLNAEQQESDALRLPNGDPDPGATVPRYLVLLWIDAVVATEQLADEALPPIRADALRLALFRRYLVEDWASTDYSVDWLVNGPDREVLEHGPITTEDAVDIQDRIGAFADERCSSGHVDA